MDTRTSTWFVVASGPSLTKEDVTSLKGQRVICINNNYVLAPWSDVLYACDRHWWDWHAENVKQKFRGRKITRDAEAAKRYGLEYWQSIDAAGISSNPKYICEGANSGIQAINLAYHLGARRIVLLGFDMQETGGRKHWHADHPNGMNINMFNAWGGHRLLPYFDAVAEDAKEMGLEIINATRETALKCFPRAPLSSLLPALV